MNQPQPICIFCSTPISYDIKHVCEQSGSIVPKVSAEKMVYPIRQTVAMSFGREVRFIQVSSDFYLRLRSVELDYSILFFRDGKEFLIGYQLMVLSNPEKEWEVVFGASEEG